VRAGDGNSSPSSEKSRDFSPVMMRNIEVLRERRREQERKSAGEERIARVITRFAGSMVFVYAHAAMVVAWILINLGWTPLRVFDPSFVILATVASVEAIFISTFVLISQNRAAEAADRRAELDLQINLLAEHEITRMLELTVAIARHHGLVEADDARLNTLKQEVEPDKILDEIEDDKAET
jgi:uncharacterized membrane protein